MTAGNFVFYEIFYWMKLWGKSQTIVITYHDNIFNWHFANFAVFIMAANLVTLIPAYIGGCLISYAYVGEAVLNDSMVLSQYMLWFSAPTAFTLFLLWRPEEAVHWPQYFVAMLFLIVAQLVLRWH